MIKLTLYIQICFELHCTGVILYKPIIQKLK